jgi:TRAP-type mannitol/chloroaromatic compound transport system permease small subunit
MSFNPRNVALRSAERCLAATDTVCWFIALLSGALFLFLSFYITADALGRTFGGPYSGATIDISVYTLAAAGTWGFAHALRRSAHVRVDLLLPFVPLRMRYLLNIGNMLLIAIFAAATTYFCWGLTLGSWQLDARSITPLQTPLVIPQALMTLGIAALAVEAIVITIYGIIRYASLDAEVLTRDAQDPLTDIGGGSI